MKLVSTVLKIYLVAAISVYVIILMTDRIQSHYLSLTLSSLLGIICLYIISLIINTEYPD